MNNNLKSVIRTDLSRTTNDFEACIKIDIESHHNIICGVVYRHPHSNIQTFLLKKYNSR